MWNFLSEHSEKVKYFLTREEKFCISKQPWNVLFLSLLLLLLVYKKDSIIFFFETAKITILQLISKTLNGLFL